MKAIILAAGIGSRLDKKLPQALSPLPDVDMIISWQLKALRENISPIYPLLSVIKRER